MTDKQVEESSLGKLFIHFVRWAYFRPACFFLAIIVFVEGLKSIGSNPMDNGIMDDDLGERMDSFVDEKLNEPFSAFVSFLGWAWLLFVVVF